MTEYINIKNVSLKYCVNILFILPIFFSSSSAHDFSIKIYLYFFKKKMNRLLDGFNHIREPANKQILNVRIIFPINVTIFILPKVFEPNLLIISKQQNLKYFHL